MSDEVTGIGISWLWMLPDTHPFFEAAVWHDQQYTDREDGVLLDSDSRRVDKFFYEMCLEAAETSWQRHQAYLFYRVVRVWGIIYWPEPTPYRGRRLTKPSSPWVRTY